MKSSKKHRVLFAVTLVVALGMVLGGLVSTFFAYGSYRDKVIEYQNRHLISITASVNRSLEAYLDHYTNSIIDFVQRSNVASAEIRYVNGADEQELLERMHFHLNQQQDRTALMSMQRPDGICIGTGTVFCSQGDRDHVTGGVALHLTTAPNGNTYLSFCYTRENETVYSIHVPLLGLFQTVTGDIVADGTLFLTDPDNGVFFMANRFGAWEYTVDTLRQTYPGLDLESLKDLVRNRPIASEVVENLNIPGLAESYLLNCMGLELTGTTMVLGTAMDRAEVVETMQSATVRLSLSLVLLAVGVLLLLFVALRTRYSNEQAAQEIELLRERSRLLEEINLREQKNFHAQRLQEVGTMAAGIVHEFNNLLTPIMGYTMMTLDALPAEDSESYDNLLEVYNASKKAKEVVHQIGQMSRKNADLTYTSLEIDVLLDRVLNMATLATRGQVQVTGRLNCPGLLVSGSETMLHQTFLNLCINACQSMGESGGTLTVETELVRHPHGLFIQVRVRDTGPGIAPAIMDRIFEPFFTTKESGFGTGLGLAIARHVVEAHNGMIRAENEPEGGACFEVLLPVLESEEESE